MAFLKKYPLLCTVLTALVLAFVAQAVLAFLEMQKAAKAEKAYVQASRQLRALLSPADKNQLALLQANVEKIDAANAAEAAHVNDAVKGLRGAHAAADAKAPATGADLVFELQGFVDKLTRTAAERDDIINAQSGLTETTAQVKIPDGFSFGFGKYIGANVQPPADAAVPAIFKQQQILRYLITTLYSARPKNQPLEIVAIDREAVEGEAVSADKRDEDTARSSRRGKRASGGDDLFQINPSISARVPGAIEAVAFRLKFVGYTDVLRNFLNALGKFELPLVVRSVEVQPFGKSKASQRKAATAAASFDALFGAAAAPAEGTPAAGAAAKPFVPKAPVVSDNLSEYTVVVEYVSITDAAPAKAEEAPRSE